MSTPSSAQPRVSVIVPVYATASFIAEALDSVLRQSFTDYEIIVVNDGSPDSKILEEVLEPYRHRITYIVQENLGSSAARNAALKIAKGEYVAMLDSDDLWLPEYLASQLCLLDADRSIDIVYADAFLFSSDQPGFIKWSDVRRVGGDISFLRVLTRECQIYGGVTGRRETFIRVGSYDQNLESGEDYELWLRVLKAGGRIVYNERVLAYNRLREGSHTSKAVTLNRNVLKVLDKLGREMDLTKDERAVLDDQRAGMAAVLNVAEGKDAFLRGDAQTAIAKLRAAANYSGSWKLRTTIFGLRIAPGILRWFYHLRERWEKRQRYAENGSPPA